MIYALIIIGIYVIYAVLPTYLCKIFNKIPLDENEIMLTFDDGPDLLYTNNLLALLKQYDVKATFFVVVKKAVESPAIVQRMLDEGHTVGIHSYEHKNALLSNFFYVKKDFKKSIDIMSSYNWNVRYYRAPWGHINLATLFYIKKYKLKTVLWSVMAQDWKEESSEAVILDKIIKRTKSGSVICLHDSGEGSGGAKGAPLRTINALKKAIPMLKSKGYRFTTPNIKNL